MKLFPFVLIGSVCSERCFDRVAAASDTVVTARPPGVTRFSGAMPASSGTRAKLAHPVAPVLLLAIAEESSAAGECSPRKVPNLPQATPPL